jgi:hypothetical protein
MLGRDPAALAGLDPRARQAFLGEIERRKLDITEYEITVEEAPLGFFVYTEWIHRPPRTYGSSREHPSLEVRISKATWSVVEVIHSI